MTEPMVDVINFECTHCCNLTNKYTSFYRYAKLNVIKKYDYATPDSVKICITCYHRRKNRGHKEERIKPTLDSVNPDYIHDKSIRLGCSGQGSRLDKDGKTRKNGSYRPDFLYEFLGYNLIIEVDEEQHSSYGKLCINSIEKELCRIINMHELDLGGMPLIMVRFNPDKYKNSAGDIVKAYVGRELILKKTIASLIDMPIEKISQKIIVYYLFYDGFDGTPKSQTLEYSILDGKLTINHIHPADPEKEIHIFDI